MSHVFISYIREDKHVIDRIVKDLRDRKIQVWLDREQIMPGQRWQNAIRQAIESGAHFIACFSATYEHRQYSYVNEELTLAIEQLRKRPTDRAWFIPVILDKCSVPDRPIGAGETLRDIQWVDLFENWDEGIMRLVTAIQNEQELQASNETADNKILELETESSPKIFRYRSLSIVGAVSLVGSLLLASYWTLKDHSIFEQEVESVSEEVGIALMNSSNSNSKGSDTTGSIIPKGDDSPSPSLPLDHRIALVIGNGKYKKLAPLGNPVNDANDIALTLKELGFKVNHVINANKHGMLSAINQFGEMLRSADVGLFYFAGHGVQVNERNYLIPIGADVASTIDVKFESIDVGRLLGKMEDAQNKVNIIILDACRSNPFRWIIKSDTDVRWFVRNMQGLAKIKQMPTGSFIVFAAAPGEVAFDGSDRNGVFTKHLLQHIKTPGLTINAIMTRVTHGLLRETEGKQWPWEASSLTREFYFIKKIEESTILQQGPNMAAYESARTTKLYDGTSNQISLDEVDRIVF